MAREAHAVVDVVGVEVERPPLGELERQACGQVVARRAVVVEPEDAQHVGILGVGNHVLVDFVVDDADAGRQRVLVGEHRREAHVARVAGEQVGVARLVGVVRNLRAVGHERPEARAADGPRILRHERVGSVAAQRVGDVGVGEEAEVVLLDAVAPPVGAGVLAAQPRRDAPAAELGRHDAVGGSDVFGVVDAETLVVVAHPLLLLEVLVEGVVAGVVARILGAGLEAPFRRELLVEGQRQRGNLERVVRVVAVGRVDGGQSFGLYVAEVVVVRRGFAAGVVAQHLELRPQRVDFPDVVEGPLVAVRGACRTEPAVGLGGGAVAHHRVGQRRAALRHAEVGELGTHAVTVVDFVDGSEPAASRHVVVLHGRFGIEPLAAGRVVGLFGRAGLRGPERRPGRGVDVEAPAVDADVGCRHVRTAHLALRRAHRDRAVQAVLAPLAERDFDDAARRVGIVVGAGDGHHLDFLNLLGPQRAQVGEQLLGLHAQLAVVDEDLRAALAVDGYLVVAHPDARRLFEQLDAVAPDGRGGVGHVDHEAVGFAADELRLDGHPFD